MMKNVVSLYKPDMPFTAVTRTSFDDALDRLVKLAKQTPRKSAAPILSCIRISSSGNHMTMMATNIDIAMTITLPVSADSSDMTAVVGVDDLRKFLSLADGDFIRITSSEDGDRATIFCGSSEMSMPVWPTDDWPANTVSFEKKGSTWFDISPSTLRIGIDSTLPAVSYEETRSYLNGAYLHIHGDKLRMVATDGHRMHMRDLAIERRHKFDGGVILPAGLMNVLRGVVQQHSYGEYLRAALSADKQVMQIRIDDMVIVARMGEGTFPDYQRIMPPPANNKITLSGAALQQFVAGAISSRPVKISAFPDSVLLEARDDDVTRRKEIDATLDGEPLQFGLSATYLKQAIAEASPAGGMVTFEVNASDGPIVITGTEKRFSCILMPMKA